MSCPKNRSNFYKKPGKNFIWAEINGNPNLYCWIPAPLKDFNPKSINIDDINIQDIPPPVISDTFEDEINTFSKNAIKNKYTEGLSKLKKKYSDEDLVSVDDIEKYSIVKNFIAKRGLKIYGGTAINAYLPPEAKFYTDDEMPDYDFFSPDPWNDAVMLADNFNDLGYKFVEAKAGIHKGTYKVFVNLWPVADITYMNKKDFEKIPVKKINGLNVVSPFKLIESMYKEFSEPFANPDRWPKVAIRQKLLEKWTNPLDQKFKCSKDLFLKINHTKISNLHASFLEKTFEFIKKKNLLICGALAYNTYLEIANANKRIAVNYYEVLSEHADEDIHELFTVLIKVNPNIEIITNYQPHKELNNTIYELYCYLENNKKEIICKITHLTSCTPYKEILGRNVVSIDYLKYELYDDAVFADTEKETTNAKCKLKFIELVQNKYYASKKISETNISPFQRFLPTCKGPFKHSMKVELLNRWKEKVDDLKKIIKIRKYPRKPVPHNCNQKSKDECVYPCSWNKFSGVCSGIPKGTYRAGENNEDIYQAYQDD